MHLQSIGARTPTHILVKLSQKPICLKNLSTGMTTGITDLLLGVGRRGDAVLVVGDDPEAVRGLGDQVLEGDGVFLAQHTKIVHREQVKKPGATGGKLCYGQGEE